jgi:predicted Zn-dependent protease
MRAAGAGSAAAATTAGDHLLSFGDYAGAAAAYRAALAQGALDADATNLHLGVALTLAGNRAEAISALQAVSGPRSEIAGLWLAYAGRAV